MRNLEGWRGGVSLRRWSSHLIFAGARADIIHARPKLRAGVNHAVDSRAGVIHARVGLSFSNKSFRLTYGNPGAASGVVAPRE